MTDRPLLLLDVDGVLNALEPKQPEGWRRGVYLGFTITWNPEIVARLREWHDTGFVEIQWLTTWTHQADTVLAGDMGMPRNLVAHSQYHDSPKITKNSMGRYEWWKFSHVVDIVNEDPGRRIVWIDDDHDYELDIDCIHYIKTHPQIYAVKPDARTGLTMEELDRVEKWINS